MTTVTSNTHAISINPATGEQIGHYAFESAAALDQSLSRAAAGFAGWKRTPVQQRAQLIIAMGQALRDDVDNIARMISQEMGKPVAQ
ncbi:aldehyde dehydrogenase family protein, partial [Pseudomonas syringae]